jgi:hypothetical protein
MDTLQPNLSTKPQKERFNQWNQMNSCLEAMSPFLGKSTLFRQEEQWQKEKT